MTELELMVRAQSHIKKLAQGTDPLTDRELPEDSLLNQVRMSRCFYYVAEVLGRVIANGGEVTPASKKAVKTAFYVDPEALKRLEYTDRPISLTDFVRRIEATSPTLNHVSFNAIRDYLQEVGLLENTVKADGGSSRKATPAAAEYGITNESRTGSRGDYDLVVYNKRAQEYIIAHLHDAAESYEKREADKKGAKFSAREEETLRAEYLKGADVTAIANSLGKSQNAVLQKINELGLNRENG